MATGPNQVNSVNRIQFVTTTVGTFGPFDVSAFRQHSVATRVSGTGTLNIKMSGFPEADAALITQKTITSTTTQEFSTRQKYLFYNVSAVSGTVEAVILSGN